MKTFFGALAALALLLMVAGCNQGGQTAQPSKVQPGLAAYEKLPVSSRNALENHDLTGLTFYVMTTPGVEAQATIYDVTATITSMMLDNGAYRAAGPKQADLVFLLSKPDISKNPAYVGASVLLTDKEKNTLLRGDYISEEYDGAEGAVTIRDGLNKVIVGLGTERRNKLLANQK